MRDRLIELMKNLPCESKTLPIAIDESKKIMMELLAEELADFLLANGVIVPPCKVGQKLYFLYDRTFANRPDFTPCIYETNAWYFDIDEKGTSILPRSIHGYKGKHHYYLGETVFFTREEAEQALKGGAE